MNASKGTRNRFLTFVLLASVCLPSYAEWRERRSALGEMYRIDEFRISTRAREEMPYRISKMPTVTTRRTMLSVSGRGFVRDFLEELDCMDDAMSSSGGRESGKWQETDQMSSAHDIYISRTLRNTLAQSAFLSRWDKDVQSLMAIELE